MKISSLIHRLATSTMLGVSIITAKAVCQINHKGKSQRKITSPLSLLFLSPLLYCFSSVLGEKFPVLFKLIWWVRMGREKCRDNYNII